MPFPGFAEDFIPVNGCHRKRFRRAAKEMPQDVNRVGDVELRVLCYVTRHLPAAFGYDVGTDAVARAARPTIRPRRLLTVVGYSLNDTIVIFDRIRENVAGKRRGVDYVKTVNRSINQTLSRTILTSTTTFIVVAILLFSGGEGIRSFSFALCVGVVVGTFSSIYVASPALIYFNDRSEKRREELLAEAANA